MAVIEARPHVTRGPGEEWQHVATVSDFPDMGEAQKILIAWEKEQNDK